MLPDGFAALALEVDRCGVEEDQVQTREQIPPPLEQAFFDEVLGAARRKRCLVRLIRKILTEPSHRAIDLMQAEIFRALNPNRLPPLVGRSIRPGTTQAVQHREK